MAEAGRGGAGKPAKVALTAVCKQSGEHTMVEDADMAFHQREYQSLRGQSPSAHDASGFPKRQATKRGKH